MAHHCLNLHRNLFVNCKFVTMKRLSHITHMVYHSLSCCRRASWEFHPCPITCSKSTHLGMQEFHRCKTMRGVISRPCEAMCCHFWVLLLLLLLLSSSMLLWCCYGRKSRNDVDDGDVDQACHSAPLVSMIFVERYMSLPNVSALGNLSLHSMILFQNNCILLLLLCGRGVVPI